MRREILLADSATESRLAALEVLKRDIIEKNKAEFISLGHPNEEMSKNVNNLQLSWFYEVEERVYRDGWFHIYEVLIKYQHQSQLRETVR